MATPVAFRVRSRIAVGSKDSGAASWACFRAAMSLPFDFSYCRKLETVGCTDCAKGQAPKRIRNRGDDAAAMLLYICNLHKTT
mmetsp:Transcript_100764/g.325221  ORF Transcript_100764/g.325221 Transcript_100764/m.325221 type:complete len:83 (+) Transcript_100764:1474-1722(+)